LTTGVLEVWKDRELKAHGVVFGSSLPSWLLVLKELGFEAALIILCSDEHLSEVEAFLGDKYVI
jgi:hypothetical protein